MCFACFASRSSCVKFSSLNLDDEDIRSILMDLMSEEESLLRCVFVLDLRAHLHVYKARALYTCRLNVCEPWPHFAELLSKMTV